MKISKTYKTISMINMASSTHIKSNQTWLPKNSTNNISNLINVSNSHKKNKTKWLLITISMIIMTWITSTIPLIINKLTNQIILTRIIILILHLSSVNNSLISISFLICTIRTRIWFLKIIFSIKIEWTKWIQWIIRK